MNHALSLDSIQEKLELTLQQLGACELITELAIDTLRCPWQIEQVVQSMRERKDLWCGSSG
ncbi:MAG: hypothetical protein F4X56_01005 [Gammaproteobacteria bacterium]|nr:hypothetical protein [Gammaproteobacteria bacterium]MYC24479.1 hypothetical protein [Gammaproteobacteria bacterium]